MKYNTLADMINKNSCSRKYFLSLPVEVRIELHNSLHELHRNTDNIKQLSEITQRSSKLHPLVFS